MEGGQKASRAKPFPRGRTFAGISRNGKAQRPPGEKPDGRHALSNYVGLVTRDQTWSGLPSLKLSRELAKPSSDPLRTTSPLAWGE